MDIEPGARKHSVHDDDMLHALRHHWRAFATDDVTVTMFIGPSRSGEPLEVGVVIDEDGEAIIMRCGRAQSSSKDGGRRDHTG